MSDRPRDRGGAAPAADRALTRSLREHYARLPIPVRREIALRRLRRWARATTYARWHNERVGADAPTVNFFPMKPEPRMQVSWMLRALRLRIGTKPNSAEPTIAWDTGTWFDERARRRLPGTAINGECLDTSKSHVDAVWAEVSGYSIAVDPLTYAGPMVFKSEYNGAHDGRLVRGPVEKREGWVTQRFIDTRHDGRSHGSRAVIIGSQMPIALDFWRSDRHILHGPAQCMAKRPEEIYAPAEQQMLLSFAGRLGMDLGELDVVRDNESGLIYVIDANRTSFRPSLLGASGWRACYRAMVPAMRRLLDTRG